MDWEIRTQRRGVASDDDQLSFSGAKGLQSALVSQGYCGKCGVSR